jgi:hypothetical protein
MQKKMTDSKVKLRELVCRLTVAKYTFTDVWRLR